jgi:hypothetical protein
MSDTYPQTIDPAQANKETPLQEDQRALDFASVFGYRASASSGLVFAYHGGTWGGLAIAADDVTATASNTNYVVVNRSSGAVSISTGTTNWNDGTTYARLYKLVASGSAITNIGDDDWDWRGGAGGAHGSASLSGFASTTQPAECIAGYIGTVADKDYRIVVKVPHAGTITETTTRSESGTATFTFNVNTTALGGTANSVSSSEQSQAHASSNTFVADDDIVITASSNSSCIGASFSIKYTRTLA